MPKIICAHCAKPFSLDPFTYWNYSGDVRCTNCGATLTVSIANGNLRSTPILRTLDLHKIPNAPENINGDVMEAQTCHAVGAYKACVVMCRRALEQVCIDLSAEGNTLHEKIRNLLDQGFISSEIFEILNEIRYFGNYGAHPNNDLLGDVTPDDSSLVLEVTLHMIKHIYEIPEKIRKLRLRRARQ